MNKSEWVKQAVDYMVSVTGEWDVEGRCEEYCESLYETYVEDNYIGEEDCTPEYAVDEDMTYWED